MPCTLCKQLEQSWPAKQSFQTEPGGPTHSIERAELGCAFENGAFSVHNWNCGTLARLRGLMNSRNGAVVWDVESQQCYGLLPFILGEGETGAVTLTWYKSRGATEGAVVLWERGTCESEGRPPFEELTLNLAEAVIAHWSARIGPPSADA